MAKIKRVYGCIPDHGDPRDAQYLYAPRTRGRISDFVDFTEAAPPCYDQGRLGSCVGNGVAGASEYVMRRMGQNAFTPSRLAIYFWAREREGSADQDAGCMIRDAMKAVTQTGLPHENIWPYKVSDFAKKPSRATYRDAALHQVQQYSRVPVSRSLFLRCLCEGYPIVFGASLFESFESEEVARTGVVPMPDYEHESLLGGHCMAAFGYDIRDKNNEVAIVRNSWGTGWGHSGYCTIPLAYLCNPDLVADCWTISLVESER